MTHTDTQGLLSDNDDTRRLHLSSLWNEKATNQLAGTQQPLTLSTSASSIKVMLGAQTPLCCAALLLCCLAETPTLAASAAKPCMRGLTSRGGGGSINSINSLGKTFAAANQTKVHIPFPACGTTLMRAVLHRHHRRRRTPHKRHPQRTHTTRAPLLTQLSTHPYAVLAAVTAGSASRLSDTAAPEGGLGFRVLHSSAALAAVPRA